MYMYSSKGYRLQFLTCIYNSDDDPGKGLISKEYLGTVYQSRHEAQKEEASEEREKQSEYSAYTTTKQRDRKVMNAAYGVRSHRNNSF